MRNDEPSDDALMLAYAGGDQGAFAVLYDRYRGPLYRYFRRQLDAAEADDCFQALWLKVIDQAPKYRAAGAFRSYLFTLAHNLLMDHFRRRGRLAEVAAEDAALEENLADGDGTTPPEAVEREQLRQRLLVLLERLPFHQREAWVMKQEFALTVEEIAAITHTSIEGVRSRLRYATGKLKAGLIRHV